MLARYPHHTVLVSLLQKGQAEACQATVQEMVAQLMSEQDPASLPAGTSGADIFKQIKDRDRELACLHNIWCMALFTIHKFRDAAEKADLAAFLAQKVNDLALFAEARFRAGVCYSSNGEYPIAIGRLTECIESGVVDFKGDAYYNRGFANQALTDHPQAIQDYHAAIKLGTDRPDLVRRSSINLAWVLILTRDFDQAERTLSDLTAPTADPDHERLISLHVAHDQAHIRLLRGQSVEALRQAVAALNQSEREYPHIRADIILTLMALAQENDMPHEAFTLGLLAKRLAGQARRFDLDDRASRRMQDLECKEGTEALVKTLQSVRQVLQGSRGRRKAQRGSNMSGGVG